MNANPKAENVLRLDSDLQVAVLEELRASLEASIESANTTEIDLSAVSRVDTLGLQVLVAAAKMASARGATLHFSNPSDAVLQCCASIGLNFDQLRSDHSHLS